MMKKILFLIGIVVMVTMVGCSKDDDPVEDFTEQNGNGDNSDDGSTDDPSDSDDSSDSDTPSNEVTSFGDDYYLIEGLCYQIIDNDAILCDSLYMPYYNEKTVYHTVYKSPTITVPSMVTLNDKQYPVTIGQEAFDGKRPEYYYGEPEGNQNIQNVIIQGGVKAIAKKVFYNCHNLVSVRIEEGITSIPDSCFYGTGRVGVEFTITLPNSIKDIGVGAFNSSSITSITLPNSIKDIGVGAFFCSSITSINLPEGLTSIKEKTFYLCKKLTTISIPASVTEIGESAFSGSGLTSITIPNNVKDIGVNTFLGCENLTSVTLPEELECIPSGTFYNSALESIHIPSTVKVIDRSAFWGTKLRSIEFPEGMTEIGSFVCEDCSNLVEVIIPSTMKHIRDAFHNCPLTTIICRVSNPGNVSWEYYCSTDEMAIKYLGFSFAAITTCKVPQESITSYQARQPWSFCPNITAITE